MTWQQTTALTLIIADAFIISWLALRWVQDGGLPRRWRWRIAALVGLPPIPIALLISGWDAGSWLRNYVGDVLIVSVLLGPMCFLAALPILAELYNAKKTDDNNLIDKVNETLRKGKEANHDRQLCTRSLETRPARQL